MSAVRTPAAVGRPGPAVTCRGWRTWPQRIAAVLGPHTQVEEQGLFPALAAEFPDQIAVLEAGHRRTGAE